MPSSAMTSIEVSVVIARADEGEATLVKYRLDEVLPRRRRIPSCLREDAVGEPERALDQPLAAARGELIKRVSTVEEIDVAVESLGEGVTAKVARHLLDECHELGQQLSLESGQRLPAPEPQPDRLPGPPASPVRSVPRSSGPAPATRSEGRPGPSSAEPQRPSSHAEREGRAEVADDQPRRTGIAPLPCLGDPDRGRPTDAHDLAGDFTPSPGRYASPTRALEHGEELAVRVADASSDLDLRGPRIRPAVGDPTGDRRRRLRSERHA